MSASNFPHPVSPPLRLMAAGTAVAIASLYLSQPILNLLGQALHGSVREMGFITTASQIGFALGIIFLVPLGDILPKRRLILTKLLLGCATLVITGLANSLGMLTLCSLAIGLLATAAQDLVPLAAELSAPARRGHAIGIVMGGLLLGILGSRIFSGVLADLAGWRAPFFATAVLALILAALLAQRLPVVEPVHTATYPQLLRSMGQLVTHEPLLIVTTLAQGCLGLMYAMGDGVPEDRLEAYILLLQAAEGGNGQAEASARALEPDLAPAQIAEGRKRAGQDANATP